jgi:hypothetical protein
MIVMITLGEACFLLPPAAGGLTALTQVVTQAATGQQWLPRDLNQVSQQVQLSMS